jgi:ABC-type uncharacterized transport system involved in gliding motility auxiliary subunit
MKNNTRGLVALVAGFAALGFALLSIFYWVAVLNPPMSFSNIDLTLKILAIAAIICFAIYLLFSPESVGKAMGKRSTRLTANALIASLVAIAIGVVINIIVDNIALARADWTAGKDFSLSQQTTKLLSDLNNGDRTITAIGFFYRQDPQQALDLLKEYGAYTSRFRYEINNPNTQPLRASQFGVTTDGTVVFTDGTKRELANGVSEREFTSAIIRLSQTGTKKVAFLTGHGERDLNGVDERGYSEINDSLKRDNYATVQWSLTTSPTLSITDVSVLVIADPQTPLNSREIQTIQQYLDAGGHALIALDTNRNAQQPDAHGKVVDSINQITSKYGVTARDGIVADFAKITAFAPQDPTVFGIDSYPSNSDITSDIARAANGGPLPTLFYQAIAVLPPPPTSTITSTVATTLLQTSSAPDSWLEIAGQGGQGNGQYDPGTDEIAGPVTIAVSVGPEDSTVITETQTIKTRLVVFGDADFAANIFLSQSSPVYVLQNGDLFSNAVSWLAGANELISIRQKDPSAPRVLTLDAGQKNVQLITAVFGLPLFVLLLGGAVWWRRK